MMPIMGARPRLLDLFCGEGYAARGYVAAGWDVTGVDIDPQPNYPYRFVQANAFSIDPSGYDAIHASPPCQAHTPVSAYNRRKASQALREPFVDLIARTREWIDHADRPYVIENVPGALASMKAPVTLCGQTFGLPMYRHRLFESNVTLAVPEHRPHVALCMHNGYLPTRERPYMTITGRNGHHSRAWVLAAQKAMGVESGQPVSLNGVCEAIPPAYTEWVGRQLIDRP